nr:hypothetical protein [Sicyoidochytrium minutum DNA virus]
MDESEPFLVFAFDREVVLVLAIA